MCSFIFHYNFNSEYLLIFDFFKNHNFDEMILKPKEIL